MMQIRRRGSVSQAFRGPKPSGLDIVLGMARVLTPDREGLGLVE
jgi:hypothetical protein